MRYATNVDTWLLYPVTGMVLFLTGKGLHQLLTGAQPAAVGWMLLGIALFLAVVFYSFATYEITPTEIVIRSRLYGFRFGAIPLAAIEEVRPTRNPLSAPAWSLERLCITYRTKLGRRIALISPRQRQAFLKDLAQRDPGLYLQGERLLRRPTNHQE